MLILGDLNIHLTTTAQLTSCPGLGILIYLGSPLLLFIELAKCLISFGAAVQTPSLLRLCISDHIFIQFNVKPTEQPPAASPSITISADFPAYFSSPVSFTLPTSILFSSLYINDAIHGICSTLRSSLDSLCPPSTRVVDTLPTLHTSLKVAESKWCKGVGPEDLEDYQSLVSFFSSSVSRGNGVGVHVQGLHRKLSV